MQKHEVSKCNIRTLPLSCLSGETRNHKPAVTELTGTCDKAQRQAPNRRRTTVGCMGQRGQLRDRRANRPSLVHLTWVLWVGWHPFPGRTDKSHGRSSHDSLGPPTPSGSAGGRPLCGVALPGRRKERCAVLWTGCRAGPPPGHGDGDEPHHRPHQDMRVGGAGNEGHHAANHGPGG